MINEIFFTPQILFFALGYFANVVKSDLDLPDNFGKLISVYLLIAVGLHGGYELWQADLYLSIKAILIAFFLSFLLPIIAYFYLHLIIKLDGLNSAAIAAHYGSVSISTFLVATGYLTVKNITYDSYPLIMLAIMESPAIIIGILLAEYSRRQTLLKGNKLKNSAITSIFFKSFRNGGVLLLIGSIVIGYILGNSVKTIAPLFKDNFAGILCLFLLAMGLEASKNTRGLKTVNLSLILFGILFPILSSVIGILIAKFAGFSLGNCYLVGVLAASASYIAVPPAIKIAIPEANPSLYLTLSIGITFAFNVTFGMHLYYVFTKYFYNL